MSNIIKNFQFNSSNSVRTVTSNNQSWFVAQDICKGLDIKDSAKAVRDIDNQAKDADITETISSRFSFLVGKQRRQMSCVNETGLNMLIFQSRKKSAFKFKYWIASEVLPSIRKTGKYVNPNPRERFLSEEQYLTNKIKSSSIGSATAKSVVEIDTSFFKGVISTPIGKCFFYVRYMVDCMGHLSRWRIPLNRSINLVQFATIKIDTLGGDNLFITSKETI